MSRVELGFISLFVLWQFKAASLSKEADFPWGEYIFSLFTSWIIISSVISITVLHFRSNANSWKAELNSSIDSILILTCVFKDRIPHHNGGRKTVALCIWFNSYLITNGQFIPPAVLNEAIHLRSIVCLKHSRKVLLSYLPSWLLCKRIGVEIWKLVMDALSSMISSFYTVLALESKTSAWSQSRFPYKENWRKDK